jgi:hypothetical protein
MQVSLLTRALALHAALAAPVFAQPAAPSTHHAPLRVPLRTGLHAARDYALDLRGLSAAFTQVNPSVSNSDGSDLWPCFGYPGNLDCPTVGNPSVPLPFGGIVLGFPSYVWSLQNTPPGSPGSGYGCDAYQNGTTGPYGADYKPCGQLETWYEDDTFDSTDDLLQRVTVTQGKHIIYDSGTVDFGPAGPSVVYPVDVILSSDANFGIWPGAGLGRNNGNCSADFHYPLSAPMFPTGTYYVVAAGRTCLPPQAGPATFTTSTILATPSYTQVAGTACTAQGVASPCYVVNWTTTHVIHQDFKIFLD